MKYRRELTDRETGSFEFEDIDPELTALLPFSSGTTGVPKVPCTLLHFSIDELLEFNVDGVAGREWRLALETCSPTHSKFGRSKTWARIRWDCCHFSISTG